jgi:hypothetical protein
VVSIIIGGNKMAVPQRKVDVFINAGPNKTQYADALTVHDPVPFSANVLTDGGERKLMVGR